FFPVCWKPLPTTPLGTMSITPINTTSTPSNGPMILLFPGCGLIRATHRCGSTWATRIGQDISWTTTTTRATMILPCVAEVRTIKHVIIYPEERTDITVHYNLQTT